MYRSVLVLTLNIIITIVLTGGLFSCSLVKDALRGTGQHAIDAGKDVANSAVERSLDRIEKKVDEASLRVKQRVESGEGNKLDYAIYSLLGLGGLGAGAGASKLMNGKSHLPKKKES